MRTHAWDHPTHVWACNSSSNHVFWVPTTPWFEWMIPLQNDLTFSPEGIGRNPSGFGLFSENTFFYKKKYILTFFFHQNFLVGNIFLLDWGWKLGIVPWVSEVVACVLHKGLIQRKIIYKLLKTKWCYHGTVFSHSIHTVLTQIAWPIASTGTARSRILPHIRIASPNCHKVWQDWSILMQEIPWCPSRTPTWGCLLRRGCAKSFLLILGNFS